MSRCFPFPPPGYEKKPRPEESDLLKEEKRKEKKHKKEKKDREKREGKEKRDKDRSDGKHREKKEKKKHRDKKEKHKDKKKDEEKDKDKDRERSSISEEARVAVLPGPYSGEKLHTRDENKERCISSGEGKLPNQFHAQHGEKPFKTSFPTVEAENSKFVQELGRRIRDDEKGAENQLAERSPVEWKMDEKTSRVGIKDSGNLAENKEKDKEWRVENKKMDGQAVMDEPKTRANAILPSLSGMAKSNSEGIPRPLEENVEKRREEKEKSKERRDDKPREKNKDKERDKKIHGKQKSKEKEKKKEEKKRDKSEHKKSEQEKSSDVNKNDFIGGSNDKLPLISKENIAGTVTEGNHRKRKDVETNGFLHESEVRPAKFQRLSSSHEPTQNGKKLDTHQKPDLFPSNKQGVSTDIKVENKERRVNGSIEGQPLSVAKPRVPSTSPGADLIAEASKRPPHPDSKYLSQVLSVPKMDGWSEFDDQEWLLGSKRNLAKKPDLCSDEVNMEHHVWSEALQLHSADICALPYVIPY